MPNFSKYLTPSSIDEKWGFYITSVGYTKIDPKRIYPDNRQHPATHTFTWSRGRILDGYYLIFISNGRGVFETAETVPLEINAGTCFFLYPGVWHRYKPDAYSGWEEYWVGFKGCYPDHLMSQHFFDKKNPSVYIGLNEALQLLFHKLFDSVRVSVPGYHQIISGTTLEILGLINSVALKEFLGEDSTSKFIAMAQFRMRESIENPIGIDQLMDKIPMSYSKFRQAFKKATGLAPNQYYLNVRIQKAKELLTTTSLNVNEIAYHTGFESVFYFSMQFKKKTGVSPKRYRNECQKLNQGFDSII